MHHWQYFPATGTSNSVFKDKACWLVDLVLAKVPAVALILGASGGRKPKETPEAQAGNVSSTTSNTETVNCKYNQTSLSNKL